MKTGPYRHGFIQTTVTEIDANQLSNTDTSNTMVQCVILVEATFLLFIEIILSHF